MFTQVSALWCNIFIRPLLEKEVSAVPSTYLSVWSIEAVLFDYSDHLCFERSVHKLNASIPFHSIGCLLFEFENIVIRSRIVCILTKLINRLCVCVCAEYGNRGRLIQRGPVRAHARINQASLLKQRNRGRQGAISQPTIHFHCTR